MPSREPVKPIPSARTIGTARFLLGAAATLVLCVAAPNAEAQVTITVTTEPPAPTSTTPVTIVVFNSCGCPMYGTPIVQTGFTFDIPYGSACLSACLAQTTRYEVGPLASGTYTVRQVFEEDPSEATVIGGFSVAAVPIPTLGVGGATALALLFSLAALRLLKREAARVQPQIRP